MAIFFSSNSKYISFVVLISIRDLISLNFSREDRLQAYILVYILNDAFQISSIKMFLILYKHEKIILISVNSYFFNLMCVLIISYIQYSCSVTKVLYYQTASFYVFLIRKLKYVILIFSLKRRLLCKFFFKLHYLQKFVISCNAFIVNKIGYKSERLKLLHDRYEFWIMQTLKLCIFISF